MGRGLILLQSHRVCCAFKSQYDAGNRMSIQSRAVCSWTTGGASFVQTAIATAARALMAAAHLWIIQTAERGLEPICSGNCHCTVAGQSMNLSATAPLSTLMGPAACLFSPKDGKWKRVNTNLHLIFVAYIPMIAKPFHM